MVLRKARVFEQLLNHFYFSMVSELSGLSLVVWLGVSAKANAFSLRALPLLPETNWSFYTETSYGRTTYPTDSPASPLE